MPDACQLCVTEIDFVQNVPSIIDFAHA